MRPSFACDSNKANCQLPPIVDISITQVPANYRKFYFDFAPAKTRNPLPNGSSNQRFDLEMCKIEIGNASYTVDCKSTSSSHLIAEHIFANDGSYTEFGSNTLVLEWCVDYELASMRFMDSDGKSSFHNSSIDFFLGEWI